MKKRIFIFLFPLGLSLQVGCGYPVELSATALSPCPELQQFNRLMQNELLLSEQQMQYVRVLNADYWWTRRHLLSSEQIVARKTAVLAVWDQWIDRLAAHLSDEQMESLMLWQVNVDLLAPRPF